MAGQSKLLAGVRPDGLEDAPQLQLDIDRERAAAQGVGFESINALLSTALLGEAPHGYHAVAFALIVAGILVSSRR